MTEAPKWTCEYCTYENFAVALKCTMCRGSKPLLNENIFRLRDESPTGEEEVVQLTAAGGISPGCGPSPRERESRQRDNWYCEVCSHVNWLRAKECAECGAARQFTTSDLAEQLRPLRIDGSEREAGSVAKWSCPTCTYDNWPRASRCVMCGTAPRVSPIEGAGSVIIQENMATVKRSSLNVRRNGNEEPGSLSPPNNPRRYRAPVDRSWLAACLGVVQGEQSPVEAFLSSGGDPTRQLTAAEVALLNRPSAFDTGHTLVHLAIRFHREDMLATLLSRIEGGGSGVKRVPSYVAPDLAADIRRHAASTLRQRKGTMPCPYLNEMPTFTLPAEIEELPGGVQEQLFSELLDKDAQRQLEEDPEAPVVNWSLEVTVHLGSRLYALWNRSAGDCLLDSLMQATWGVFDRDNLLRKALAETLNNAAHLFYPRWREYEACQARLLQFSLEEGQWQRDWAGLVSLATQPGTSLEQLHVFALAHILRRPILVYGVKYVKSFRGEDLGYARFEGVYLPLLWEPGFCTKSPVSLGYTRGHFSALVPVEPYSSPETADSNQDSLQVTFLPLMDHDRKLLPVHFVTQAEMGREEALLRQWLDVCVTDGGLLVAQQRLNKRPLLVAQMLEEWLNHYRRLAQMSHAPFSRPIPVQDYSSDGDTDDE